VMSNIKWFKYEWIWGKSKCGSPLSAKYRPMAKHEGIYHKIADQTIGKGGKFGMTLKKPFDCLFIKQPAYIVIGFYKRRQKIETYIIDIDRFVEVRDITLEGGRKSLKQEEWEALAIRNIML